MPGPFAHSLRIKIHGLSLFLSLGVIALTTVSAAIALRQTVEHAYRGLSALSDEVLTATMPLVTREADGPALERALAKEFGGDLNPFYVAVVKTSTGEILAESSADVQPHAIVRWKEISAQSGKDVETQSCTSTQLDLVSEIVAPMTNIFWNLADPTVTCHGALVRAAEVVGVNRLPRAASIRTLIPLGGVYVAGAFVGAGLVLMLLLLIGFSTYIHRRVISPLRRIRQGAIIMAQGNLDHTITIGNRDEIGVVANFINEVGRNLKAVRGELIDRKRISSELDAAAKIQQHLLPAEIPAIPGLDIAAKTKPSTEVGGDNYDFIQLDEENFIIFVGDVTGHGVPAGLVMIMIDVLIDTFSSMHTSPKEILVNVNRFLAPNIDSTMYMTMLMLGFNIKTQKLTYAAAGHEHIIHYRADTKKCTVTRSGGIALGMIPNIEKLVTEQEIPLRVGDVIVLYSDGVTEAYGGHDGKQMFGLDRLVASIERSGYRHAQGIFDLISRELADFMGPTPQNDDITLMVMKYVGANQTDIEKAAKRIKITVKDPARGGGKRWEWDKKQA